MTDEKLTLYYSPGACSLASHVAMEETGASYEGVLISVPKGETESPEFKAINPRARVPVLAVGDLVLTENCAILTYIGRRFPEANLLPKTLFDEMQCLSTMIWFSNAVHPAFSHVVRTARFAEDEKAHAAVQATGTKNYWALLQEIDAMIAAGPWIRGAHYTLCDPYALVFYGWGRRINLPMTDLKNYTAWKGRMLARPAVARVLAREESSLLQAA